MGMLVMAGPTYNLFGQGTVTCSPAADAKFPLAGFYDREPGSIFRFGSLAADSLITVDLGDGMGGFGGLNTWVGGAGGTPSGFTEVNTGGGTVTQDTVNKQEGAASALFTPGAGGTCSIKITRPARSGWWHRLQQYSFNAGAVTQPLLAYVQNLQTGRWWNGSAWQSAQAPATTFGPNAAWTQDGINLKVEDYGVTLTETCQLEITYLMNSHATETNNLDLIEFLPGVDFLGLWGHNLDPVLAITLRSSTDNFAGGAGSGTIEATLTPYLGSFYAQLAARVYRRYWRVRLGGTNSSQSGNPYLGEGVLSQGLSLLQPPGYPMGVDLVAPQARVATPYSAPAVYSLGRVPHAAAIPLTFGFNSDEAMLEFQHELFYRSADGSPAVIVPDTTKREAYFVRVPAGLSRPRAGWTFHDVAVTFEGFALPQVVA